MTKDMLRIDLEGGKYTIIQRADGSGEVLRNGETWITPLCMMDGSKMVLGMAYELERLREALEFYADPEMYDKAYDGNRIFEVEPGERARRALRQ